MKRFRQVQNLHAKPIRLAIVISQQTIAHTTPKTLRYRSVLRTLRHECRSVRTLRHWCRSVLRTLRHQCQNVLGPKCLGSEVSWHRCNRDIRKYFFSHRVVSKWNMLDNDSAMAKTVNGFKTKLERERAKKMALFLDWCPLDFEAVTQFWSGRPAKSARRSI